MPIFNPILVSKKTNASGPLDPMEVYKNTRPADWLPMPEPQDNEIYLLVHIPDGVSSLLAFTVTCSGGYSVSMNGGPADSMLYTSGTKYETELFADDFGNLTSTGMKQALVKISAPGGITWEPSAHSKKTSPTNFANWHIVEIACRLPNGTKVACGNDTGYLALKKLRYFSWYGENKLTSAYYMFYNCYSLKTILQLDTTSVTSMGGMFGNCYSLTAIPQLDTSKVTNMAQMFFTCKSLATIPQLDTSVATNMYMMFGGCNSLTTIPQLNTSKVIDMTNMFIEGYSLTTIPQLDTSSVTNMNGMFMYCSSLTTIPQLDTSSVTNMGSMFNGCNSLYTISQLDTSSVTSMSSMFSGCYSLATIPQLDTSSVTSTGMRVEFNLCYSLASVLLNPVVTGWAGCDIDFQECSLSRSAIVALFNSLPTITSAHKIKLTGNPGASELTYKEKVIATGKNWTLSLPNPEPVSPVEVKMNLNSVLSESGELYDVSVTTPKLEDLMVENPTVGEAYEAKQAGIDNIRTATSPAEKEPLITEYFEMQGAEAHATILETISNSSDVANISDIEPVLITPIRVESEAFVSGETLTLYFDMPSAFANYNLTEDSFVCAELIDNDGITYIITFKVVDNIMEASFPIGGILSVFWFSNAIM